MSSREHTPTVTHTTFAHALFLDPTVCVHKACALPPPTYRLPPHTQAVLFVIVILASAASAKRNVLLLGVSSQRMVKDPKTMPVEHVWVTATHQWRAVGTQVERRLTP